MIGQVSLLHTIDTFIEKGLPRFILLVGEAGSGKKLMCQEISKRVGYPLVSIGTGVEDIREAIVNSYRNTEPVIYVIADTDKMSLNAKNALLKVTEEPPQKAYFIITVTDTANTLNTLISRACVLQMNSYTKSELTQYVNMKYDSMQQGILDFITDVCSVPQQIDIIMTYDLQEFTNYINNICEHLHTVSSANAFKIEQKLALKKDEDRWDVLLVLQAMKYLYHRKYMETQENEYFSAYKLVCSCVNDVKYKNSANKQYCLDELILQIRQCWR